jgi:ribosomal protein S27E
VQTVEAAQVRFEVRPAGVTVEGDHLLTFRCPGCGNRGAIVSSKPEVALICTHCVDEDNTRRRLELVPVRLEVRRG